MKELIGSIAVGIVLAIIVFLIIRKLVRDKKSGKHICSGDCKGCSGACHCNK